MRNKRKEKEKKNKLSVRGIGWPVREKQKWSESAEKYGGVVGGPVQLTIIVQKPAAVFYAIARVLTVGLRQPTTSECSTWKEFSWSQHFEV